MSYFEDAYNKTMGHEGGYTHDPDDVGGETYKGIARRYNGSWGGWFIIDALRDEPDFPACLDNNVLLLADVKKLYKQKYFDPFVGDEMPAALACEMFDTAVNMGTGRAVKFLQKSLNLLNRNQKMFADMVEDGDYGNTTHRCLQIYRKNDTIHMLLKFLNVFQGAHYIEYMTKSPKQEKYARGWFKRVEITKR